MVTCQFSLYPLRTEQRDEIFGMVESVKTASDLYMPMSGEIVEVNTVLADAPETINTDPYEAGWMIKFKPTHPAEWDNLLPDSAYEKIAPTSNPAALSNCENLPI